MRKFRVLRPFWYNRVVQEIGTILELGGNEAIDLLQRQLVEPVSET
jgi:hypothetical protein